MFIDFARIKVESGRGGAGCVSFRREKFVAKGGPDGGDGGKGGDIIVIGNENINTLIAYRHVKLYKAKKGANGEGNNKTGRQGENFYIQLPLGTIIYDITNGKRERVGEITYHKQEILIGLGGNGGRGNARFKTSTNKAPRYAKPGGNAEIRELELELKLMADVGLVGFPNAGKSTLVSSFSEARPKIANYEFTTLSPSLGVVKMSEYQSFVMADIPGIIEGAHIGKGLGIRFLRHIQRTKILLFLIDINKKNPFEAYEVLKKELHLYDTKLDKKAHIIALNKIDSISPEIRDEVIKNLKKEFDGKLHENIIAISAVTGENTTELKQMLFKKILEARKIENAGDDDEENNEEINF